MKQIKLFPLKFFYGTSLFQRLLLCFSPSLLLFFYFFFRALKCWNSGGRQVNEAQGIGRLKLPPLPAPPLSSLAAPSVFFSLVFSGQCVKLCSSNCPLPHPVANIDCALLPLISFSFQLLHFDSLPLLSSLFVSSFFFRLLHHQWTWSSKKKITKKKTLQHAATFFFFWEKNCRKMCWSPHLLVLYQFV